MSFLFRRKNKIVHEIKPLKPKSKWRFLWWGMAIVIIGVIGWFSTTAFLAYQNLSSTNDSEDPAFFKYGDNIDISNLTTEGGSRINVLLLGNGGSTHPGGNLTDSIQVLSIDPVNKTMSYLSIPRDLYVTQVDGTKSKINAVYTNGAAYCKVKTCATGVDQGGAAMEAMVSSIIGQPIHYFIKIDFSGFEKIIDTLGGIDIYVDKAIYDPYYPDSSMTGYSTFSIKAGQQHMTGATALKYARSRETTSDFDRARRQQQVISAIREKALSAGVLANPTKISTIITTLGTHLKTDISLTYITKFASLIKEVDGHQGESLVLDTSATGPLKSSSGTAGYIITPKLGASDYTDLKIYVLKVFSEPYLIKENAKVSLVNATGKTSGVESLVQQLKDMGYNITTTTSATSTQSKTTIASGSNNTYTLGLLKKRFSVSSIGKISSSDTSGADIVLTIGSDYSLK